MGKQQTAPSKDYSVGWEAGKLWGQQGNKRSPVGWPYRSIPGVEKIGRYNAGWAEGFRCGYIY